jgi:formamidopyrimidine-DNA glycosylase
MPELPDIELYLARLRERVVGERLERLRLFGPFVLRSVGLAPSEFEGCTCLAVTRLGKRIVLEFEGDRFVVIHLMIAGRLQWQSPAPPFKPAMGKIMLAAIEFASGRLSLVETSTRKRAGVWLI